jgi:glycosyltransferase involved in cell wall biosynthesis
MDASVIIPCFNVAKTISLQLDALKEQDYGGTWEIIIADNGSTDETLKIVEKYKEKLPILTVVSANERRGRPHALNVAAKIAKGDILLFCDGDDMADKAWVSSMAKAIQKYKFVAGSLKEGTFQNQKFSKSRQITQQNGLQKYYYPPFLDHAGGGNLGIQRELHNFVGGFDETMLRLADTDYCWRLQLSGVQLYYEPSSVMFMRMRETWKGALGQKWQWGCYNVFLYKKYRPFGMPELTWKTGLKTWIELIKRVTRIRGRLAFKRWILQVAWKLGRIEGCIKYRVVAF